LVSVLKAIIKHSLEVSVIAALLVVACEPDGDRSPSGRVSLVVVSFEPPTALVESLHKQAPGGLITYCFDVSKLPPCSDGPSFAITLVPPGSETRIGTIETSRDLESSLASITDYYARRSSAAIEFADHVEVSGIQGIVVRVVILDDRGRAIALFVRDDYLILVEYETQSMVAREPDKWREFDELIDSMRPLDPGN
jgi:hypothetical protein